MTKLVLYEFYWRGSATQYRVVITEDEYYPFTEKYNQMYGRWEQIEMGSDYNEIMKDTVRSLVRSLVIAHNGNLSEVQKTIDFQLPVVRIKEEE